MLSSKLDEASIAVVDLETTGLVPGGDRIVEISIVRVEPNGEIRLVLDTLVNPQRPVSGTEIHGIHDEDVAGAPTFADIAGDVARALHGSVFAAYNVYFDARFIQHELSRLGLLRLPPQLCLMYLRPMLQLGVRCSLRDACRAHGVDYTQTHQASSDALAAARLWRICLASSRQVGISTFADLARTKSYKFVDSWSEALFAPPLGADLRAGARLKPRAAPDRASNADAHPIGRETALHEYWEALKSVLSDLVVSPEEQAYLLQKRADLGLSSAEQRAVHARIFADILRACADDRAISDDEDMIIRGLHRCLGELGWAPGT